MRATLVVAAAVAAATLGGCAAITDDQKRNAINAVNAEFRRQYEEILKDNGTRSYRVNADEAFQALRAALVHLGMNLGDQELGIGYLNVYALAPAPLDHDEWEKAEAEDLPKLREIITKYVGPRGYFIRFEPEGLQIVINATVLEVRSGSEISLTMRMREVKPPPSGMPRRDYAPPAAVRTGLDKIWGEFERELRVPPGR